MNPQSAVPRAELRRTITLLLLVVATAVALLLGHSLERMHDAKTAATASTVSVIPAGDAAASPITASGFDAGAFGSQGGAELCALLAIVCAAILIGALLMARSRPGRGAPMTTAPPAGEPLAFVIFALSARNFSSRSTALRL